MKYIYSNLLILGAILISSCEKLVDVGSPQDLLVSSTVFKSDETATSAMTAIYATMMRTDYPLPYNLPMTTGVYCDELQYSQSVQTMLTLYKNTLIAKDAVTNQLWTNGFNYIYQANAILESLERSEGISANVKNQLQGEALFVRSFWNFHLSNLYGRLPLIISTDYVSNAKLSRTSVEAIHNQIIKDLLSAKSLLTEKYVAANSVSESLDRIRPNTFAVSALLSKVYLETKEYGKAADEATRIIENNRYALSETLPQVFKRTSKEVIWQIELPTNIFRYINTYETNLFTLTTKPSPSSTQRSVTISPMLLSSFDSKDKRRSTWISTFTDNSVTPAVPYHYPSKYKTRTSPADEYTTPFRLAEMYLVRAEARARLGLIAECISDIDKTRNRAGLDLLKDIVPNISREPLLDSVFAEKRRELFCEWGIRWNDLRRLPDFDEKMKAIAQQKGTSWKATAVYWPIPLNDVLNSINLIEQNEGYN